MKHRYKEPDQNESQLLEVTVIDSGARFEESSKDFQFAASVAAFGMLLRDTPHKGDITCDTVLQISEQSDAAADDYRREFRDLVRKARVLAEKGTGR